MQFIGADFLGCLLDSKCQYRDVVCLLRACGELLDRLKTSPVSWSGVLSDFPEEFFQAVLRVQLIRRVHRFRDAVGEQQQGVLLADLNLVFSEGDALYRADNRAVPLIEAVELAIVRSMYGGLCPALVKRSSPERTFTIATKSVTNMHAGLSALSSSLTRVTMLAGDESSAACVLIIVFVTAMNNAAGTPFPETSPSTRQISSSLTKKKS